MVIAWLKHYEIVFFYNWEITVGYLKPQKRKLCCCFRRRKIAAKFMTVSHAGTGKQALSPCPNRREKTDKHGRHRRHKDLLRLYYFGPSAYRGFCKSWPPVLTSWEEAEGESNRRCKQSRGDVSDPAGVRVSQVSCGQLWASR